MDQTDILARITPQPLRRIFAAGFLAVLGALLIYLVAERGSAAPASAAFLFLIGLSAAFASVLVWNATSKTLELTRHELREKDGRTLCKIEDVARVSRGFFAFKPASGFALTLTRKEPIAYVPGLWWRLGRRVMIGGATSGGETKTMAEIIQALIVERDAGA